MQMIKCIVTIPALNPTENLIYYVRTVANGGIAHIIVVNDGSAKDSLPIFNELNQQSYCTVLTHETNQGKGRALKTAFTYINEHFKDMTGVVTADADGQHAARDVIKIAALLDSKENRLILGVRDFNQPNVPKKSILGNKLTRFIFHALFKEKLSDTQTGLRGIAFHDLPWLLQLKGERYEYEINMLINAIERHIPLHEIEIETLYFNNNAGSYYKSIRDSLQIMTRITAGFFRKGSLIHSESPKQIGEK
jgi:glycosyltransferase involved in cell wall biosynthesis